MQRMAQRRDDGLPTQDSVSSADASQPGVGSQTSAPRAPPTPGNEAAAVVEPASTLLRRKLKAGLPREDYNKCKQHLIDLTQASGDELKAAVRRLAQLCDVARGRRGLLRYAIPILHEGSAARKLVEGLVAAPEKPQAPASTPDTGAGANSEGAATVPLRQRIKAELTPEEYAVLRKCLKGFINPRSNAKALAAPVVSLFAKTADRIAMLGELAANMSQGLPGRRLLLDEVARMSALGAPRAGGAAEPSRSAAFGRKRALPADAPAASGDAKRARAPGGTSRARNPATQEGERARRSPVGATANGSPHAIPKARPAVLTQRGAPIRASFHARRLAGKVAADAPPLEPRALHANRQVSLSASPASLLVAEARERAANPKAAVVGTSRGPVQDSRRRSATAQPALRLRKPAFVNVPTSHAGRVDQAAVGGDSLRVARASGSMANTGMRRSTSSRYLTHDLVSGQPLARPVLLKSASTRPTDTSAPRVQRPLSRSASQPMHASRPAVAASRADAPANGPTTKPNTGGSDAASNTGSGAGRRVTCEATPAKPPSPAPAPPPPPPKLPTPATASAPARAAPKPVQAFIKCVICHDRCDPPYISKTCGHGACHGCWEVSPSCAAMECDALTVALLLAAQRALAVKQECPMCRTLTRMKFLIKLAVNIEVDDGDSS